MKKDLTPTDYTVLSLILLAWILTAFIMNVREFCTAVKQRCKSLFESSHGKNDAVVEWCWSFVLQFNIAFCGLQLFASFAVVTNTLINPAGKATTAIADYVTVLALVTTLLFYVSAKAVRRLLGAWEISHMYYIFAMMVVLSWTLTTSDEGLLRNDFAGLPVRVCLSLLPLRRKVVVTTNILYACVVCWQYVVSSPCCEDASRFVPTLHILMSLILMNCPVIVQNSVLAVDKANRRTGIMYSAAMGLLNLLCDVVIELGEGCCLEEEAPKLNAMLFLQGSTSLRGMSLTNFMPEAEQRHFLDALAGIDAGRRSQVGAINVTMNDSIGNTLRLEAFYVQIQAVEVVKTRYLIGLREHAQNEDSVALLPPAPMQHTPSLRAGMQSREDPPEPSESSFASSSEYSTAESVATPGMMLTTLEAKMMLLEEIMKQTNFEKDAKHNLGSRVMKICN
eukprot:TRINITY_DN19876_c0_g1_i1.p1 TRINITY_DN19876_c0_g1~~TRINITY_DN19876_c0_g1_i1.p1  ORF type:complete len:450 (-),score=59.32 TRINITY_DN19876_c0_g1_i1:1480-2829(-)